MRTLSTHGLAHQVEKSLCLSLHRWVWLLLPYLVPDTVPNAFHWATSIAVGVVLVELAAISWIRHRYMDTPLALAVFQVVVGGLLVFLTGVLIGHE